MTEMPLVEDVEGVHIVDGVIYFAVRVREWRDGRFESRILTLPVKRSGAMSGVRKLGVALVVESRHTGDVVDLDEYRAVMCSSPQHG